jgi:hypothetical protein
MTRLAWWLFLVVAGPLPAAITVGEWKPLFQGVELARGEADKAEPRLQRVVVVRVDLRAPGIELFATPANGDKPLETTSETTSEFLVRNGLQVAINANFFGPCCSPGDKDLTGLAISKGEIVSVQEGRHNGSGVLLITRDNRASITVMNNTPIPTDGVWTAISGSGVVLIGGAKPPNPTKEFGTLSHPRSAVGLTKDGRYLILMTVDGRQDGYSQGATLAEVADWLARFGAHDGINLDGGGSTTLAAALDGRAVVLNRPSGAVRGSEQRQERSNGNNFGVWARPLVKVGAATTR